MKAWRINAEWRTDDGRLRKERYVVAIADKYQAAEALRLRANLEHAKLEMVSQVDLDGEAFDIKESGILCLVAIE